MELAWIIPAVSSTAVYACVTIGDKLILTRLRIRLSAYYFFTGATQFGTALLIFAVAPPVDVSLRAALEGFGGGFCWGAGLMVMFWALTREEVSRVAPVWHTSPVVVAIMAVFVLGESLTAIHWIAIALVVSGAAAVSVRVRDFGNSFGLRPIFLAILASAIIIGMGQLLLKEASEDQSVWSLMAFRGIGLASVMSFPFLRVDTFRDLYGFMRSPRRAAAICLNDGLGPFVGNLLMLLAISNGPISLVSAVVGSRPVFVLAGAIGLSKFSKELLDEDTGRSDLAIKAFATASVVAGVVLIALA